MYTVVSAMNNMWRLIIKMAQWEKVLSQTTSQFIYSDSQKLVLLAHKEGKC